MKATSVATLNAKPDVSPQTIHALQQMLLHAYEWGIANGYITFDGDGQPVFAVPVQKVEGGMQKAELQKVEKA